jgi:hypothetical protein
MFGMLGISMSRHQQSSAFCSMRSISALRRMGELRLALTAYDADGGCSINPRCYCFPQDAEGSLPVERGSIARRSEADSGAFFGLVDM